MLGLHEAASLLCFRTLLLLKAIRKLLPSNWIPGEIVSDWLNLYVRNNYHRLYNIQLSTISIDPVPDTLHAHVMCKHETSGTLAWTNENRPEQLSQGVTVSVSKGHQWNCCRLNDNFLNYTCSCKTVQSDMKENLVPSAPSKLSLIRARLLVDIYNGKITWILHICSVSTIFNQ